MPRHGDWVCCINTAERTYVKEAPTADAARLFTRRVMSEGFEVNGGSQYIVYSPSQVKTINIMRRTEYEGHLTKDHIML